MYAEQRVRSVRWRPGDGAPLGRTICREQESRSESESAVQLERKIRQRVNLSPIMMKRAYMLLLGEAKAQNSIHSLEIR